MGASITPNCPEILSENRSRKTILSASTAISRQPSLPGIEVLPQHARPLTVVLVHAGPAIARRPTLPEIEVLPQFARQSTVALAHTGPRAVHKPSPESVPEGQFLRTSKCSSILCVGPTVPCMWRSWHEVTVRSEIRSQGTSLNASTLSGL